MKFSKVAAVVAGSVAALGAASPAFAADGPAPMSLNGGAMDVLAAASAPTSDLPLHLENAVTEQGSAVNSAVQGVEGVNDFRNHAPDKVMGAVSGATDTLPAVAPMLGGLHVNGG
ncbi:MULTISPECIES: hypothetical protein [unclassified Streptomyces]|uniref:hypothetical protein n=1 Tax=unclassified Streptomyces TaxID=2593676 RepID=UPI0004BEC47A|nr:hypothetical protein [Streptomyces sp. NRRL S-87]